MLSSKEIAERRNSILEVVTKAKDDLVTLDSEIDASVAANKEAIAALASENAALAGLKTNNANTRRSLLTMLKK